MKLSGAAAITSRMFSLRFREVIDAELGVTLSLAPSRVCKHPEMFSFTVIIRRFRSASLFVNGTHGRGSYRSGFRRWSSGSASGSWSRRSTSTRTGSASSLRETESRAGRRSGPSTIRPWTCREEGRSPPVRARSVVPVGNDHACRNIKMRELQPKISGRLRAMKSTIIFPMPRTIANAARKRGWYVIDNLGRSAGRFIYELGYPEELFDAFENCRKGEGADVEELDIVDKKDKASGRSCNCRHYPRNQK